MTLYRNEEGKRVPISAEEEAEILAEREQALQAKRARRYAENRSREYPSIGDQLDAIYKGIRSIARGEALSPECVAWLLKIQEIKDKYPKPEDRS